MSILALCSVAPARVLSAAAGLRWPLRRVVSATAAPAPEERAPSTPGARAQAEALIRAHDLRQRFFLYLAYQAIHSPDQVTGIHAPS